MKEIIIIIIMTVPRAVGVLVLGLDSPISPVVMTARLQEPAMLSSGHYMLYLARGRRESACLEITLQNPPLQSIHQSGKKYNLSSYI